MRPKGEAIYRDATVDEILSLEGFLNQWVKPQIETHPTLGLVVVVNERERLVADLGMSVGYKGDGSDEQLVDGVFSLYSKATKHTIAFVTRKNGDLITKLLCTSYALKKED